VAALRPGLLEHLRSDGLAALLPSAAVCTACLASAATRHALTEVKQRREKLSDVEAEIATRATAIADEIERGVPATFGNRAADAVARVGGSWAFVIGFLAMLGIWCAINIALVSNAFDPYPFILLNLVLSCLASIQAPIILMSQSRMAEVDRIRATEDFRINLKAELEVASLHEKMDHLLHQQWDRLVEMQEVQLQILEELRGDAPANARGDGGGDEDEDDGVGAQGAGEEPEGMEGEAGEAREAEAGPSGAAADPDSSSVPAPAQQARETD
jgi:uncharacterized membrane protein